jgi:hypothetical protein
VIYEFQIIKRQLVSSVLRQGGHISCPLQTLINLNCKRETWKENKDFTIQTFLISFRKWYCEIKGIKIEKIT